MYKIIVLSILLSSAGNTMSMHSFPPIVKVDFYSSNLPIVIIDTEGKALNDKKLDERISATMKILWKSDKSINTIDDQNFHYVGNVGIKYRGNSSFAFSPKKPYSLELWDKAYESEAASVEIDRSLLGMSSASDWVLLAPYNDKSYIRDVLMFELMRNTQHFVSQARYCELIFNGEYYGLYILAERVQRGKNRIDLASNKNKEGRPQDVGYLIEVDRDNEPGFRSQKSIRNILGVADNSRTKVWYQYKYPKYENISDEQISYITNRVHDFESVMESENFNHPENGYRKYLNENSVAAFMIAQEFCRNVDAYRLSTPMYKYPDKTDTRFHMALWDFNLGFGNCNYGWAWSTEGWAYNQTVFAAPFWFKQLQRDDFFREVYKQIWAEMRQNNLNVNYIETVIDSLSNTIKDAVVRNNNAWQMNRTAVWPNYYVSENHEQEIDYLKKWIKKRLTWMDGQLLNNSANRVANSNFEADTVIGIAPKNSIKVSQWPSFDGLALTNKNSYDGQFSYTLNKRSLATQHITELEPGLYTMRVKVKTSGKPDAYIFVKNHGRSEQKINIPNINGDFRDIELNNIEVSNKHCEIGIAAWFSNASEYGQVWYDNVEFFKHSNVSSSNIQRINPISLYYNSNSKALSIETINLNERVNLKIIDLWGRVRFSKSLVDTKHILIDLEKGLYMCIIENQHSKYSQKIFIE